jgi:hypothetical protein
MATSTIPAVKAAIVSAIQARPALAGVQVTWGIPHDAISREWICVGDVIGSQDSAAIGQQRRDESYTVQVIVNVVRPSLEPARDVSERCFVLVAEIEQALRPLSAPPLGVADLIWALVEKTDLTETFDTDQRTARATVHIACRARI